MSLYSCTVCGRRTSHQSKRCPQHQVSRRPRGNAYEGVRQAVAERDRWTCQICHKPINPVLKRPHPRALHIDHIVPRADFGADDPANLRATHAECNLRRGRAAG